MSRSLKLTKLYILQKAGGLLGSATFFLDVATFVYKMKLGAALAGKQI